MEIVDVGVNLGHHSFDRDRLQVIDRACAAGVVQMVVTGSSLAGSRLAQQLASEHPGVLVATVGVHPHDARHCDAATLPALSELAKLPQVVALGECGLDYHRDFSPRPAQDHWFEAQVQLACELRLPLFLHERDAHTRFVDILKPYRSALGALVVHCFTGTSQQLDTYLDLGFHIGITGWICDERRGLHLRELIRRIPLERLMLESDAPFLTPRNIRPKPADGRNEPACLPYVLQAVAVSLGRPAEEVAEATTRTSRAFFGLEGVLHASAAATEDRRT